MKKSLIYISLLIVIFSIGYMVGINQKPLKSNEKELPKNEPPQHTLKQITTETKSVLGITSQVPAKNIPQSSTLDSNMENDSDESEKKSYTKGDVSSFYGKQTNQEFQAFLSAFKYKMQLDELKDLMQKEGMSEEAIEALINAPLSPEEIVEMKNALQQYRSPEQIKEEFIANHRKAGFSSQEIEMIMGENFMENEQQDKLIFEDANQLVELKHSMKENGVPEEVIANIFDASSDGESLVFNGSFTREDLDALQKNQKHSPDEMKEGFRASLMTNGIFSPEEIDIMVREFEHHNNVMIDNTL